eukprot:1899212-Amphidinium_carterae.1
MLIQEGNWIGRQVKEAYTCPSVSTPLRTPHREVLTTANLSLTTSTSSIVKGVKRERKVKLTAPLQSTIKVTSPC